MYAQELADPAQPLAVGKLTNLSSLGSEEVPLFTEIWLQMDLSRRQRLVQELIDLAEDTVELNFDAVWFIALTDLDAGVRLSAVKGLWEYEGRDLIDSLLDLLERDPNAGVRAEAALSLGRFVLQAERVFGRHNREGSTRESRMSVVGRAGSINSAWEADLKEF